MSFPNSVFGFITYFVVKQWFKFLLLCLSTIIWAVNDTFFPYFLKIIINTLQFYKGPPDQIFYALKGTLILIFAFWMATEIMLRVQGIVQLYAFPEFRSQIRNSVFNYVKLHSPEYFANNFAGNLAKKLANLPTSAQTLVEIVCMQFLTAAVGATIVLVMMWQTKPIFAMILSVWLFFHLGLTALFVRYGNYLWADHADSETILTGKIVDVFSNILNVRLFSRNQFEYQYLQDFQKDEMAKSRKAMWLMELTRIGLGIDGLLLIFGMISTLIYGYTQHWVSLGDITQIGMQTFWLMGWIWFISYQMLVFARESGTVSDALSLVRKTHDLVDAKDATPLAVKHGEIIFKDVTFDYRKGSQVFENLNVTIPAGQKVGLVGFSGSGKSTFVNLILRFYDLNHGQILLDGQDIATVTQDSLREQIAMIPQDPTLFHRSLMENIRYGDLNASDDEVIAASKLAHCHEFISKLPEGYAALVGERGVKLSGGQRQRIAIARAILKNAPILILDEATSALDSVTERLIQESLHHLMEGRTAIVVAHRLSTLSDMDRILVFDKGHVVEDGTREELLLLNGHFARLWNMQTEGFLPQEAE